MKKNPFYSLQIISGTPQLLPFGQAVAAQMPGIQLDGCAAMLWSLMDQYPDIEELVSQAVSRMDISESERSDAESDIRQYIAGLTSLGILEDEQYLDNIAERVDPYALLQAGPMRVKLSGGPEFFHPDFKAFLLPADAGDETDQDVLVTEFMPPSHAGMDCLLQNSELEVYCGDGRFILRYPTMPDINACMLSGDGSRAVFYVSSAGMRDQLQSELFHAIRHPVLYRAQMNGLYVLHSVSVLYRGLVWLFSAPAGTGKSTHADLWHELFDTPILNGDLAMISISDRGPVFHPAPWCGTSGIAVNETHPLGGVVFLKRGQNNSAAVLPQEARQLRLANRLISPVWTEEQLADNLAFAEAMSAQAGMWELSCTPEQEAAICMKAAIDRYLEEGEFYV